MDATTTIATTAITTPTTTTITADTTPTTTTITADTTPTPTTTTTTATRIGLLDLPYDILLNVLDFLEPKDIVLGVGQTCRELHEVTRDPRLWKTADFDINNDEPRTERHLQELVGKMPSLSSVLTGLKDSHPGLNPLSVTQGAVYPCLKRLIVYDKRFPHDAAFLQQHRQLLNLTVKASITHDAEDDFERLRALWQHITACTELCALTVYVYYRLEDPQHFSEVWRQFGAYMQSDPALKALHLVMPLSDALISATLVNFRCLTYLKLWTSLWPTVRAFSSVLDTPNWRLTDLDLQFSIINDPDVVYAIVQGFPNLRQLCLDCNARPNTIHQWTHAVHVLLTPNFFPCLISLELRIFRLNRTPQLALINSVDTDRDPRVKGLRLPNTSVTTGKLKLLIIRTCWDEIGLFHEHIVSGQPDLQTLELTPPKSSIQVIEDAFLCTMVKTCRRLQKVKFETCQVSQAGLAHLRTLPDLNYLECCPLVGGLVMGADPTKVQESRLEELHLWPAMTVSDDHLWSLAALCPGLTDLHITGPFLGVEEPLALQTLLKGLRSLKELHLESTVLNPGCVLGDEDLEAFLELGTSVESFTWLMPVKLRRLESLARVLFRSPCLKDLVMGNPQMHAGGDWEDHFVDVMTKEIEEHKRRKGPPKEVEAEFTYTTVRAVRLRDLEVVICTIALKDPLLVGYESSFCIVSDDTDSD